ncbi:MAG: amidohydrolase [Candidatus Aminicenantes bacterium]|nr:MAG: amidohydrolase [Candidatus Aminicenantes bacterium]
MNFASIALLCFLVVMGACKKEPGHKSADLVLLHGKILTLDAENPEVEALAAKGETILAIGSDQDIQSYVGNDTSVIDLNGMLVIPGLIDGHGHYMSLGESLMGIDLRHAQTWQEIVGMVEKEVQKAKPGEWIVGRGWHQDKWISPPNPNIEGLPIHHNLSEISPDNPVLLIHVSGHGAFVNARALDMAGYYPNTLDPIGGEIVRDKEGNPTGMLRETAQDGAREALARYKARRSMDEIEAELRDHVRLAAEEAIANGITTFHDMGESFETIDLLKRMAEEGNLPVRLCVAIQEPARILEEKMAMYRMVGYGDGYLTVRAIGEKVLDGALGTHGGWLLEPYSDKPESTGFNVTPIEDIQRSAELAIQHDYQMEIQGIGDRACRELLDIYEDQFAKNPDKKDLRWRIEHCQVIHPDDLPRFKQLGVIASVRGVFATSDGPWVVKRLGEGRTRERGYLYQTLFQSGAVVINGTDPPVEDIDPIVNFYCSVTRKTADGAVFFPEQRMTRQQALESYTINPAYAAFEEGIKGTLTSGKLADITVLSKDIMTIPEDEILSTEVVYTIIGGKIKFDGSMRSK